MKFLFIITISAVFSLSCLAQKGGAEQKAAMQKLHWMTGNWSGTSTASANKIKKITYIRESVLPALDGTILLVNVKATDKDSVTNRQTLAYTSFSVISYDAGSKKYRWTSWRTNGHDYEEEPFTVGTNSFEYIAHKEEGKVRYKANLSSKGEFLEKGDYTTDGTSWTPFINMRLLKTK